MVNVTDVSSTHCRSGVPGPKAVLLGVEHEVPKVSGSIRGGAGAADRVAEAGIHVCVNNPTQPLAATIKSG